MSILIRIGAAGVIGFAATSGASAHTIAVAMDHSDFLEMSEAPLDLAELSNARGGFKVAGFNFNFGVKITPVEIAPVFGPGGVFGKDGPPPSSKADVFGEDGPPPSSKADVFGESDNDDFVDENNLAEQPSLQSAIVQTPAVEQHDNGVEAPPPPVDELPPTAPEDFAAVQPAADVSDPLGKSEPAPPTFRVAGADVAALETYDSHEAGEETQTTAPTVRFSADEMAEYETFVSYENETEERQTAIQSDAFRGLHLVLNNSLNNVKITRVINLNLDVGGYDANITRSIGNIVTARLTSTYGLFSRF